MEPRRVWNPPNPYLTEQRDLLGEPPNAELEIYEDESKSILSHNDSPDLGFSWSVNPYRGCFHACAYCIDGETPILMADGRTRPIAKIRVGDEIYGTIRQGDYRRYVRTRVLAHWATLKPAFRVHLQDGTELIASGDHRFLTNRGWKYVTGTEQGNTRRPHLTLNVDMMGTGRFAESGPVDDEYRRGYLTGIIRGDGLIGTYNYGGLRRSVDIQHQFRLAMIDLEALRRARDYLLWVDIQTLEFAFSPPHGNYQPLRAIRTQARTKVERIRGIIEWPPVPSRQWFRGFLAGIFDAEGSYSCGILRIANTDPAIIDHTQAALRQLGFHAVVDSYDARPVKYVRLLGGLREALRFFHAVDPAITRKRNIEGQAIKNNAELRVANIEPLGVEIPMVDITTGTGDFIANGVVSHNCYARPTHEYFGLGAGTDFERKIFVKLRAPELLEASFRKPSWKGELVIFSGVTDCYQPIEAGFRITRRCLKVCLAFRNPVGIITKSLLIRRDAELLAELAREADAGVSVSIPFYDEKIARIIEPGAPTIKRRFETMEILAKAGVPVSIGVAPIIPGLNDMAIPTLLKEAKRRGATGAFRTLLRLPGSVKAAFFHRLQQELPGYAAKVEHRIRETRSGKLYDSRFGHRHGGEGPYWDSITQVWDVWTRRLGFNRNDETPKPSTFRRPPKHSPQLEFSFN